ncbi:glycosyltransferase [Pseudalkalibacillus caeni]|uniref:Glycosyltransferase family 2 protein n=1 Tax=Exobacillus caeni TaxID=2574798 RepID=A0A5R9F9D3_9BACL|nr:glycosyltransferase [Pseudalkalibacillus caeni]TLS37473.1 glycosyltransferase family 2 protein [Pseudalkalibacillus caeni]
MKTELGIIIATTESRKESLLHTVTHLIKHIHDSFTLYIYNDAGPPLLPSLSKLLTSQKRSKIHLVLLNDQKEISTTKVGCGGSRYHLFEKAKMNNTYVLSLDDDMQITPNWFETMKEAFQQFPDHSVFTGVLKHPDNSIQAAGANFTAQEGKLRRIPNKTWEDKHHLADWGPLGYLVLCRQALQPPIKIPPLYVHEDAAFLLELRQKGIVGKEQTVVVTDAVAIHRALPVRSSNLRQPQKMAEAKQYIKRTYGLSIL